MKLQVKKTADRSNTLYSPELDEHYHSTHGALQESLHVFINEGFKIWNRSPLSIFEMGFGTGLNTMLTFIESQKCNLDVTYHAIDIFPLDKNVVNKLNYHAFLEPEFQNAYDKLIEGNWNESILLSKKFRVVKSNADMLAFPFIDSYDLVYWDAFSPDKQPELWSSEIFTRLYCSMNRYSFLVTYSSKGSVRRNLETAGFEVMKIPGPKGKREMIRAQKNEHLK